MNRRTLIALASVASIATWTKPIVNSIILPAHAQTSPACGNILDVDVIGAWRFTSSDNVQFDIEFLDQNSWTDGSNIFPWMRDSNGELSLDIGIGSPLIASITVESNCIASELEIQNNNQFFTNFVPPATGVRN